MTPDDISRLIDQYRAGLAAEMNLLRQLAQVSREQQDVAKGGDFDAFGQAADDRDGLMQSLVTIEAGMREIRQQLTEHREQAVLVSGFDHVATLHREAAQLISSILAIDSDSLSALADAELARRSAVAGIERGETTLAAYRRVLAPPVGIAKLVNRRG